MIRLLEVLADKTMVVDFTVYGEDNRFVGVGQWLGARV